MNSTTTPFTFPQNSNSFHFSSCEIFLLISSSLSRKEFVEFSVAIFKFAEMKELQSLKQIGETQTQVYLEAEKMIKIIRTNE
jgi:hypothetical protein